MNTCTGGIPIYHDIKSKKKEKVWKLISKAPSITKYLCTGTDTEDNSIISGHSYAIVKCYELGEHKLIRMKNPWGRTEWSGRWADNDKRWTEEMKTALQKDGHVFGKNDDGIFVMDLESFCSAWSRLSGCFVYKSGGYEVLRMKGCFVGEECKYWVDSLLQETQYHLDVKADQEIVFSINHKSQRFINDEINENSSVNIFIRTSANACKCKATDPYEGEFTRKAAGVRSLDHSFSMVLNKGKYIVIPKCGAKYKKAENNKYLLCIVIKGPSLCEVTTFN